MDVSAYVGRSILFKLWNKTCENQYFLLLSMVDVDMYTKLSNYQIKADVMVTTSECYSSSEPQDPFMVETAVKLGVSCPCLIFIHPRHKYPTKSLYSKQ